MSASGNPALVMRRKKHTEKEVHAHLISVVSVRLREGYTIREISLTKGKYVYVAKLRICGKSKDISLNQMHSGSSHFYVNGLVFI